MMKAEDIELNLIKLHVSNLCDKCLRRKRTSYLLVKMRNARFFRHEDKCFPRLNWFLMVTTIKAPNKGHAPLLEKTCLILCKYLHINYFLLNLKLSSALDIRKLQILIETSVVFERTGWLFSNTSKLIQRKW